MRIMRNCKKGKSDESLHRGAGSKTLMLLAGLVLGLSMFPQHLWAHGVIIDYREHFTYEIHAKFDTGEPMGEAQVVIYSPKQPQKPWGKGMTDEQGFYTFKPDMNLKGDWLVEVRKAGHGASVSFSVGEKGSKVEGSTGYTAPQTILMLVCVLWGLLGTALYFKGRRN